MINVNIPRKAINQVYLPYLDNSARTQIYFGGSSSGKSKFIVGQKPVYHMLKGGHNYLVCRQTKNSVRASVATEIARVIDEWELGGLFTINKTDGTVTCINGYQIQFAGLDDVEKLKSITFKKGALTDIVVEEATETERKSIKQLMKRQRGKVQGDIKKTLTMLFNPILQQHWIYVDYFSKIGWTESQKEYKSDSLSILKTTYKDNRFLTEEDISDLENETDKYYYDVYTLGNWGVLGDVIFSNWKVEDLSGMTDQFTNPRYGLDFGFASHPAGISVSHYDATRKIIYIYDELYETGLTNDLLSVEALRLCGNGRIIGDSAEPKSITEMQNHGVNITGAKKGKDSITFGVDWLKQQTIIIDKKCVNHVKEFQQYQWKKDANGNTVSPPKPIDKNNHLLDALRYAYEGDMVNMKVEVAENPFYN